METKDTLHQQRLYIGVTTVVEVLSITSLALRLLARRLSGTVFGYDDYVMGFSWVSNESGPCGFILRLGC